jgi:hypothetical protein
MLFSKRIGLCFAILSLLAGCSSHSPSTSVNYSGQVWINDAQTQVPFTIITPGYIPSGSQLAMDSVDDPPPGKTSKMVHLGYSGPNGFSFQISEANENYRISPYPTFDKSFELDGVQIIENQSGNQVYFWNYKNMYFVLYYNGYSRDECLKIIESLFY